MIDDWLDKSTYDCLDTRERIASRFEYMVSHAIPGIEIRLMRMNAQSYLYGRPCSYVMKWTGFTLTRSHGRGFNIRNGDMTLRNIDLEVTVCTDLSEQYPKITLMMSKGKKDLGEICICPERMDAWEFCLRAYYSIPELKTELGEYDSLKKLYRTLKTAGMFLKNLPDDI